MYDLPWNEWTGPSGQFASMNTGWGQGQANNQQPYPFETFPSVVQESICEMVRNMNAPVSLIGSVFLGGMSLACQGLFDVSPAHGRDGPCSCYIAVLADSGVGKTSAVARVFAPFNAFEERSGDAFRKAQPEYQRQHKLWSSLEQRLRRAIEKKVLKGEPCDEEKQRWDDHAKQEPQPPKLVRQIFDDATQGAMKTSINEYVKSIGIISGEGGEVLTGPVFTKHFIFNDLWSGQSVRLDRVSTDSFVISGARCTILLCVQPGVFGAFLAGRGEDARESGFLARTFVVLAEAQQRPYGTEITGNSWEHLPKFQAEITRLLEQQFPGLGQLPPPERQCLVFAPEAERRWLMFERQVQDDTGPGRIFTDFKDLAAKLPDNVARVAALFHVFDGQTGPIPVETLDRAERLCCWYIDEFRGIFSGGQAQALEEADAALLDQWLTKISRQNGIVRLPKNQILQRGPDALRNKARLDPALDRLSLSGRIRIFMEGKTRFVYLNSAPAPLGNFCYGRPMLNGLGGIVNQSF